MDCAGPTMALSRARVVCLAHDAVVAAIARVARRPPPHRPPHIQRRGHRRG
jgi:hypothetical protein